MGASLSSLSEAKERKKAEKAKKAAALQAQGSSASVSVASLSVANGLGSAGPGPASPLTPAPLSPSATQQTAASPASAPLPASATALFIASELDDRKSISETENAIPEYVGAVVPLDESERHATLCSLNVLDTEPEKRFDDITRLCCMVFKAPIALVSLVDKERQWFKSVQGLPTRETDRRSSFCAWTLLPQHPEVLVVENALEDVRFRNNPLVVGFPHIRFYAGCPLVASNKMRLGSLCVIDNKPRTFDAESCNLLANFAEMVVREIEKDKVLAQQAQKSAVLSQENSQLLRAIDCFGEGILLCNLSLPRWPMLFANEAFERITGIDRDESSGTPFWDMFFVAEGQEESARKRYTSAVECQQSFEMSVWFMQAGIKRWLHMQFRCAHNNTVDSFMPLIGIPSMLASAPQHDGPLYYFATISGEPRQSTEISSSTKNAFTLMDNKLDPFEDVRLGPLLGKGSYGRVYRGQWNGAQVAVKVLETLARDDGEDVLEAVLGGQISHPNVVQTYKYCVRASADALDADNHGRAMVETWMIMEFCNKGSVSDAVDRGWFRKRHSLFESDFKAILSTAKEVASAMCYLHGRNILHGDLSSNNVLLGTSEKDDRRFTAKVADFGLSRVIDDGAPIQTHTFGTVTHMPPELLVDGVLSKAADVWAFGVMCWEMFSGTRPYQGLTHGQILHHITTGKLLTVSHTCPSPYKDLLFRCFHKDQAARPTFAEILPMLDELEEELC